MESGMDISSISMIPFNLKNILILPIEAFEYLTQYRPRFKYSNISQYRTRQY